MTLANQLLQQVFTNLILNAQQAMPEGGEIKITAENIVDEKNQIPAKIRIEFSDTGCGVPQENLQRVFEPFFTTKLKDKGTGLGLSVSYQIIQDHKGAFEVKSQPGKGSTFIITLPVYWKTNLRTVFHIKLASIQEHPIRKPLKQKLEMPEGFDSQYVFQQNSRS